MTKVGRSITVITKRNGQRPSVSQVRVEQSKYLPEHGVMCGERAKPPRTIPGTRDMKLPFRKPCRMRQVGK